MAIIAEEPMQHRQEWTTAPQEVFPGETRLAKPISSLAFLAKASAVLGATLDYEKTLRELAELAVPRLAAGASSTWSTRTRCGPWPPPTSTSPRPGRCEPCWSATPPTSPQRLAPPPW
ncbi:MAG: hypothetical protein H0X58_00880 [Acidimicrobiia bacterium]|nr:hypothetical protein [Acidimicrobiia bacterium]